MESILFRHLVLDTRSIDVEKLHRLPLLGAFPHCGHHPSRSLSRRQFTQITAGAPLQFLAQLQGLSFH